MLEVLRVDAKPVGIKKHHSSAPYVDMGVAVQGSQTADVKCKVPTIACYRDIIESLPVEGDDGFVFLFPRNHVISISCWVHQIVIYAKKIAPRVKASKKELALYS